MIDIWKAGSVLFAKVENWCTTGGPEKGNHFFIVKSVDGRADP